MKYSVKETSDLLSFLMKALDTDSKSHIRKIIRYEEVMINGVRSKRPDQELKPDDTVEIIKKKKNETFRRYKAPFPVLFEDENYIAVDKPAGLLTSGGTSERTDTAFKAVNHYIKENTKGKNHAYVVHRLDKEVSGIVLFAKSEEAAEKIKTIWPDVEKKYYAFVEGTPKEKEGTIQSWLKEYKEKIFSVRESPEAKLAITHYSTLKTFTRYTLLEVKLETGRKNQIRVHLSDIGCPIIGDYKYGASKEILRRIRLHAFSLSFVNPYTALPIIIESPMPVGFLRLGMKDEKYK